jgi:hypothetical protein
MTDHTNATAPEEPAASPLLTRWAEDVDPDNPPGGHPRPQMARTGWLSLNGTWGIAPATPGEPPPFGRTLERTIRVPFPMESVLSGIRDHFDRAWYRRVFDLPSSWRKQRILLHFGASDWETTVFVNGKAAGTHRGGYDPFSFDITDCLNPTNGQELVVGIFDPTDAGDQPRGKQVAKPQGIWYTPVTGIWQTVWLEPVPESHISRLSITPDVDTGCVRIRTTVAGPADGITVIATVKAGRKEIGSSRAPSQGEILLDVPDARLWTPDKPFLYDLKVALERNDTTVDAVDSYFGMRKIEIGQVDGITRILLNGTFVFQVGPLDQGFWPDGIYTAPTDDALRFDIVETKRLGFNMIRKHVKVEPERWYYWADKLGILVWQDMPSGDNRTAESRVQFEAELRAMMTHLHNHPSIVMWVVFNEGWGQYDTERVTAIARHLDPTRLVSNASGWTDRNVGHVIDLHDYPGPGSPLPEPGRAAVLGEFGGIACAVPGHMWTTEHWGYQAVPDSRTLTGRYEDLLRRAWELKDSPGLSAVVYTQTTDVETECNGLLTYDREVLKLDPKRVARANRGKLPPVEARVVIPTSETTPWEWSFTLEEPGEGWANPDYDDGTWKRGLAGFGASDTGELAVWTRWETGEIWLRRTVEFPRIPKSGFRLLVHHDGEAEVFLNGVFAVTARGFTDSYEEMLCSPEAAASLKTGHNTIAIHAKQKPGGRFLDAGIVQVKQRRNAR